MSSDPNDDPIVFLEAAVRRHPGNVSYLAVLAEAYLERGEIGPAIATFQQALTPGVAPRVPYLLALALVCGGRGKDAVRVASEVIRTSPALDRAYYLRARAHLALDAPAPAFADLREATEAAPARAEYRLALARVALALRRCRHAGATAAGAAAREALVGVTGMEAATLAAALDDPTSALEPAWPALQDGALGLLPSPIVASVVAGVLDEQSAAAAFAWDLDLAGGDGPGRTRRWLEVGRLLREGRGRLGQDRPDAAMPILEEAWALLGEPARGEDDSTRSLRQGVAEALAVACVRRRASAPSPVSLEQVDRAGARYPRFLAELARTLHDVEARGDVFALEVYVASLEASGAVTGGLRRRLLAALAHGLRVTSDLPREQVRERIALLERLHRSRPGLSFPRYYLGRQRYASGDFEGARAFLVGLGGRLQGDPRVLTLLGRCAEREGNAEAALSHYRRSLDANPYQPFVSFLIGRLLLDRRLAACGA